MDWLWGPHNLLHDGYQGSFRMDWLWGPHNLLYDGYQGSFLAGKSPELGGDHPLQFSAEIEEKVELYSLSVP